MGCQIAFRFFEEKRKSCFQVSRSTMSDGGGGRRTFVDAGRSAAWCGRTRRLAGHSRERRRSHAESGSSQSDVHPRSISVVAGARSAGPCATPPRCEPIHTGRPARRLFHRAQRGLLYIAEGARPDGIQEAVSRSADVAEGCWVGLCQAISSSGLPQFQQGGNAARLSRSRCSRF